MCDTYSMSIKHEKPITSLYTLIVADIPFPLKCLVSYSTDQLLGTNSKDVEKISHFLIFVALGHLLGPLTPEILVSNSLDVIVNENPAYNKKFVHLQIVHLLV